LEQSVIYRLARISAFFAALAYNSLAWSEPSIPLEGFAQNALRNDPLLQASAYEQIARTEQANYPMSLPDPSVRIGMANLPVDSFEFDQEPMTQLTVGIKQALPRLKTRELKSLQGKQSAAEQEQKTQLRRAEVVRQSRVDWLSMFGIQRKIALLKEQRSILNTLHASKVNTYEHSATARQSSLLRLQTEILMLDEQLLQAQGEQQALLQQLRYWTPNLSDQELTSLASEGLANLTSIADTFVKNGPAQIEQALLQHPSLRISDEQLNAADLNTELAKDAYKPQFAVEASYGYRDDSPLGAARSDFASIALSFDLPIRQSKRQDYTLRAAEASRQAANYERSYLARKLKSEALALQAKTLQLQQRAALLQDNLLPLSATQITSLEIESLQNASALTDLLDAQVRRNQYQLKLNDTEIALWKTTIELQFYLQPGVVGLAETRHEN
jgi:outer membrane protein TolC